MYHHIDKEVKSFLKLIFCVVGKNSPYKMGDFVHVLLDAAEHTDFTNNTCVRVGGPTGETVFSRLKDADFDKIKCAFYDVLARVYPALKRVLRNRVVALAFDTTDEPYYGKIEGLYIHGFQPVRGSTGCFKYITVSVTDRRDRLILGSLPVRVGADIVALVMELLKHVKRFVTPDLVLFDRGFDDLRLVDCLQQAKIRYQILWRKDKWAKKLLKVMKRGEIRELIRERKYSHEKSKHKIKARYVLIKKYKRSKKSKAYDWVFCTNTRQKSQHYYVDKYKKRWSIETAFRVLDNIQIRTTTKNPIIRYFINILCCLIYNLWKITTTLKFHITLKNFVAKVVTHIKTPIEKVPDG